MKTKCATCDHEIEVHRLGVSRYCLKCRRDYAKKNRKKYCELSEDEKFKAKARSTAKMAVRRGTLIKQPCEVCGNLKVEMHHDDYSRPLDVNFLCVKHHKERDKQKGNKPVILDTERRIMRYFNTTERKEFYQKALNVVNESGHQLPKMVVFEMIKNVMISKGI